MSQPRLKYLVFLSISFFVRSAFTQYISVVDGYNVPFSFQSNLSFNPNLSTTWQLRYLSGTHLRLIAQTRTVFSQTIPNLLNETGQIAHFIDFPLGGDAPPWVASFDSENKRQVILRKLGFYPRSDDIPQISSRCFDAIALSGFRAKDIEWTAAFFENNPRRSKIVFYQFKDDFWISDTLSTYAGTLRGPYAIQFLRHTPATKSIAMVVDSTFNVLFWNGENWKSFQIPFSEPFFSKLEAMTVTGGQPVWYYGLNIVQLRNDSLTVEKVPLDSTVRNYTNQGFFVEPNGNKHVLYHVREENYSFAVKYLSYESGIWQEETLISPAPSRISGAVTVIKDTVFVAITDLIKHKILFFKKVHKATWQSSVIDKAGDVGIELSVDINSFGYQTAVAFYDRSNKDLKIAYGFNSYGFEEPLNVQTVDTLGDVGRFPKVAIRDQSVHIVYLDVSSGKIKHAYQSPFSLNPSQWSSWQIATIDSVGEVNIPFGFLNNKDGFVEIAYENASIDSIKYAFLSDTGWIWENIAESNLVAPGEISIFRTQDSLYVGFVDQGKLSLAVRKSPGIWELQTVPIAFEPAYATWTNDFKGNIHVVYRVRQGFNDEIRHAQREGSVWSDQLILQPINQGTYLRLKPTGRTQPLLILAFVDDSRAQSYEYNGNEWWFIAGGNRFMSDTFIDFTLTDLFTLTLFYRALGPLSEPFEPAPLPELVADVVMSVIDDVEEGVTENRQPQISQFPNPFNEQTTIEYTVPIQGQVRIEIYDLLGRRVKRLMDEIQAPGSYLVSFSGNNLASGVYFCRYTIAGEMGTRKMLLVK